MSEVPEVYLQLSESELRSQPGTLNETGHNAQVDQNAWSSSPMVYHVSQMDEPAGVYEDPGVIEIDLDQVEPLRPPDGGWGWLIVLGSFVCMILVDGVCFSYGIFLSELEATFGASKMQMTLAGSLLTGCYFMIGPVVSGLMNRFGPRKLVFIGSAISSAAILGSSFARDVNTFIVVFGVIGGVGYGFIYLPAATIVTAWFVKKRATVTGIIMAGSGIGVTCYSLVLPHLISVFTWRGCILILSAVNLHCAVAGALFRPLSHYQSKKPMVDDHDYERNQGVLDRLNSAVAGDDMGSRERSVAAQPSSVSTQDGHIKRLSRHSVTGQSDRQDALPNSATDLAKGAQRHAGPVKKSTTSWDDLMITHGNQLVPVPEGVPLATETSSGRLPMLSVEAVNWIVEEVLAKQTILSSTSLAVPERLGSHRLSNVSDKRLASSTASQLGQLTVRPTDNTVIYKKSDNMGSTSYFASVISMKTVGEGTIMVDNSLRDSIVKELRKEVARPVHKKDLFLSGSLVHIDEYLSHPGVDQYIRTVTEPVDQEQARNPFLAMLKNLFGFEILRSPTFILLAISSIVTMIGYIVPYQFLKDNAQTYGYDEAQSSYLLAYLGIANTLGRVLSGWLSDRPWANVLLVNNLSLILSGIATALVPLMTNYVTLLIYACFYGFVISAFVALRTILIVEVLGLDRLTNAFGFLLLFQGVAIVAAPPLLGSLYDTFRNFSFTFILGGLAILLSGILCLPLAIVARYERRRAALADNPNGDSFEYETQEDISRTGMSHTVRLVRDRCARFCWPVARKTQPLPEELYTEVH